VELLGGTIKGEAGIFALDERGGGGGALLGKANGISGG